MKTEKNEPMSMIGVNNDAQSPASRHVHTSGEKFQALGALGFSSSAMGGE
jgi:hypothetical protein